MKFGMACIVWVTLLLSIACGHDLQLDPRQEWKTDEMVQKYEVDIFYSASGFAYYVAKAVLATEAQYGSKRMKLPSGDTLMLNGETLAWSAITEDYRLKGTTLPTEFSFVWNHAALAYPNLITPFDNPPTSVPSLVSKAQGLTLSIASLPSNTTAIACINAGTEVKAPFYALPLEIDGVAGEVDSDISKLGVGHGVLTLLETQTNSLQSPTTAGGTLTLLVQYGYHITIEE